MPCNSTSCCVPAALGEHVIPQGGTRTMSSRLWRSSQCMSCLCFAAFVLRLGCTISVLCHFGTRQLCLEAFCLTVSIHPRECAAGCNAPNLFHAPVGIPLVGFCHMFPSSVFHQEFRECCVCCACVVCCSIETVRRHPRIGRGSGTRSSNCER